MAKIEAWQCDICGTLFTNMGDEESRENFYEKFRLFVQVEKGSSNILANTAPREAGRVSFAGEMCSDCRERVLDALDEINPNIACR